MKLRYPVITILLVVGLAAWFSLRGDHDVSPQNQALGADETLIERSPGTSNEPSGAYILQYVVAWVLLFLLATFFVILLLTRLQRRRARAMKEAADRAKETAKPGGKPDDEDLEA